MKRSELVRQLVEAGCLLFRNGGNHDIYLNPITSLKQPVPRHQEIDNALAKHIKKYLGIDTKEVFQKLAPDNQPGIVTYTATR